MLSDDRHELLAQRHELADALDIHIDEPIAVAIPRDPPIDRDRGRPSCRRMLLRSRAPVPCGRTETIAPDAAAATASRSPAINETGLACGMSATLDAQGNHRRVPDGPP